MHRPWAGLKKIWRYYLQWIEKSPYKNRYDLTVVLKEENNTTAPARRRQMHFPQFVIHGKPLDPSGIHAPIEPGVTYNLSLVEKKLPSNEPFYAKSTKFFTGSTTVGTTSLKFRSER